MSDFNKLKGRNARQRKRSRVMRAALIYIMENGPSSTQKILNNMTYRTVEYMANRGKVVKGRDVLVKTTKSCPSINQLAAKLSRHGGVTPVYKKRGEPTIWGLSENYEQYILDDYRYGA
tara:strand:- start:21042 stop:21398 length:357 start_codon:yes stop_codon:yes gene_type:complete